MAGISTYGLSREFGQLTEICKRFVERLAERGITEERLKAGGDLVQIAKDKETAALQAETVKEKLTEQEKKQGEVVVVLLRGVGNAVKKQFGRRSKEGRDFHIGEKITNTAAATLRCADDAAKAFPKYKSDLAQQGIVQADMDTIKLAAASLDATGSQHETAKRAAVQATAAAKAALNAAVKFVDSIHSAALMEFTNEPAVLADFASAKKLRYQPRPRHSKSDDQAAAQEKVVALQPAVSKAS